MHKYGLLSLFVVLALFIGASPQLALAQAPPPSQVSPDHAKEGKGPDICVDVPPPDAQVHTLIQSAVIVGPSAPSEGQVTPDSYLPGPGGAYATLNAILSYYHVDLPSPGYYMVSGGARTDFNSGVSMAQDFAHLQKISDAPWSGPGNTCSTPETSCSDATSYHDFHNARATSTANTTVWWQAGGSTPGSASVDQYFY